MKVVVEISKEYYDYLMSLQLNDKDYLSYEINIIRDGVPLSEAEEILKTSEIIDRFGRTDSNDFHSFENGFKVCLDELEK